MTKLHIKNINKTAPLSDRQNTLWNAAGCFFYLGCQWVTTVFVAVLSNNYADAGYLAFAMSAGNIYSSIALFKTRPYQVSDVKRKFTEGNYIAFRYATTLIALIAMLLYLPFSIKTIGFLAPTLFYLIFKLDESFTDVYHAILQSNNRMDYIGKSEILRGIATLLGFVATFALLKNLLISIITMAFFCIAITQLYDKRNAKLFCSTKPIFAKDRLENLLKECALPMFASLFAGSIVSVARQRYGIDQGEELLGIYASIATPSVIVQVAASYLYTPLYSTLAKGLNKSIQTFKRLFLKILLMISGIECVLIIALSFAGPFLLTKLYGMSIVNYIYTFPYVLISTATTSLLYFLNDCLIIMRRKREQLVVNLFALLLVTVTLNINIKLFSMNGLNTAIIASTTAATIIEIIILLNAKTIITK